MAVYFSVSSNHKMKQTMNQQLKKTKLYSIFKNWRKKKRDTRDLKQWKRNGCPSPPPHIIKQIEIKRIAQHYGLKIFVETGTFQGDMVDAMKTVFNRLYSIELSRELFKTVQDRFASEPHIMLIQGDSKEELKHVVEELDQPALFWLDGHYSAGLTARGSSDTPIIEELEQIFSVWHFNHVILIDDARCFGSEPDYPGIDELKQFILSQKNDVRITVKNDSIIVIPEALDSGLHGELEL